MEITENDELLGFWENDLDDSSGLHAIWGHGTEFLPNGQGYDISWGGGKPREEDTFFWQRTGNAQIIIRYGDDDEWETIDYEITDLTRLYGWHSIVEKGKTGFLGSEEPLGRRVKK